MAVPTYQDFMRPVLAFHADGLEHYKRDIWAAMADAFQLTDEDRNILIPSGGQRRYTNRTDWAVTYMVKAGLLERPRRSFTRITDRGRLVLDQHPERVDDSVLRQFADFVEFKEVRSPTGGSVAPTGASSVPEVSVIDAAESTPEERLQAAYQELGNALADDLLDRVLRQSPEFFEHLVLRVLTKMGYGGDMADASRRVGRTGDEGIDGVIRQDRLGLDEIYVQAKRWQGSVGRPVIQAFVGALQGWGASKGVLITTSTFTSDARSYVERLPSRVVLVDGRQFAELMIEHGVGVSEIASYSVRQVDTDFFPEEEATELDGVVAD